MALIVSLPSGFIFGFPIKHLAFLLIFFIYFSTGLKNINFFVCFLSFFLIFVLPFLFSGVIDFGGWALRVSVVAYPFCASCTFCVLFWISQSIFPYCYFVFFINYYFCLKIIFLGYRLFGP